MNLQVNPIPLWYPYIEPFKGSLIVAFKENFMMPYLRAQGIEGLISPLLCVSGLQGLGFRVWGELRLKGAGFRIGA